jgi:ribosomal protein S18 acetylase RimI-like enzyme
MADQALDDPVRAALWGPQGTLAVVSGAVRRFPPEIGPFLAFDDPADRAWDEAARLVGGDDRIAVVADGPLAPTGWHVMRSFDVVQMTGADVEGAEDGELLELGAADVPEMVALASATSPGPFAERTIELGRYVGARVDGRIAAMGGERMRPDRWVEVSAICTDPAFRGRGLGTRILRAVVAGIRRGGAEPFLHVQHGNPAIALYASLGFRERRRFVLTVLQPGG